MRPMLFAIACLIVSAILSGQAFDRESDLGARVAGEIRTSTTPVASRMVQEYVDRIGGTLAPAVDPRVRFSFLAVTDELVAEIHEPRAVPGGYIFVPSSLILAAKGESEFVGMLAQAMARSLHPLRLRANGDVPLVFVDGPNIPSQLLPPRREIELQADLEAVRAMARSGFDPAALARYIDREQRDQPRSALPDRATRLAALEHAIRDLQPVTARESDEFERIQQEVRPAAPKPRSLRSRPR